MDKKDIKFEIERKQGFNPLIKLIPRSRYLKFFTTMINKLTTEELQQLEDILLKFYLERRKNDKNER